MWESQKANPSGKSPSAPKVLRRIVPTLINNTQARLVSLKEEILCSDNRTVTKLYYKHHEKHNSDIDWWLGSSCSTSPAIFCPLSSMLVCEGSIEEKLTPEFQPQPHLPNSLLVSRQLCHRSCCAGVTVPPGTRFCLLAFPFTCQQILPAAALF